LSYRIVLLAGRETGIQQQERKHVRYAANFPRFLSGVGILISIAHTLERRVKTKGTIGGIAAQAGRRASSETVGRRPAVLLCSILIVGGWIL